VNSFAGGGPTLTGTPGAPAGRGFDHGHARLPGAGGGGLHRRGGLPTIATEHGDSPKGTGHDGHGHHRSDAHATPSHLATGLGRQRRGNAPRGPCVDGHVAHPAIRATYQGACRSATAGPGAVPGSVGCGPTPEVVGNGRAVRSRGGGWRAGRVRGRPLRGPAGGAVGGRGREGQGGRHLPATEVASPPSSSSRRPPCSAPSPAPRSSGVQADQPVVDFAASQARKQKVVDQLWKGLTGLMKSRKITMVKGTGSLGGGHTVKVDDGTELKGHHVVVATGSVPRTPCPASRSTVSTCSAPTRCSTSTRLPGSAAVIGGGAIGVRVRLDDVRPRRRGHRPGSPAQAAARVRRPIVVKTVVRAFEKRGITVRGGREGDRPTSLPGAAPRWPSRGGDTVTVDMVVMAVGRRPLTVGRRPSALPGWRSTTGASSRSTSSCAPPRRASTRWATWSTRPSWPTWVFAEAIVAVKDMLGEGPVPVDYDKRPVVHLHPPPKWAFAGLSEQARPAMPATT